MALLIPGGVALLSDTVGFLTLLSIDIGIIRELAIAASLGVAMIILTNLVLLPLLISLISIKPDVGDKKSKNRTGRLKGHPKKSIWDFIANFATKGPATVILIFTALLFFLGHLNSQDMKIGELHAGAPALHETSRYNQDTFLITSRYAISVDYMSIIVETTPDACTHHEIMNVID